MAFLTYDNIQSELPTGANQALVGRLLLRIEQDLRRCGLVFDENDVLNEARKLRADSFGQSIFNFDPISGTISATIKEYGGSYSKPLEINEDFLLVENPYFESYYYRLELLNLEVSANHYVELSGDYGILINFGDTTNFYFKLLKSVIVEFIIKSLDYQSSGYNDTVSSSTGDSSYSMKKSKNREYYSSIIADPEFQDVLSYFCV